MTVKNFEKPYQMKILTTYLKKTNFFLIYNPWTNKTNPLNKKTVRFRLNCLAKVKMMFSVKQAVFDNILKNDVFLIHFKKISVFLKDLTKLSFLNFSGVNLNTKIYLFNIFTHMNSFCYLQQKLLIFKHFMLYFKNFSK